MWPSRPKWVLHTLIFLKQRLWEVARDQTVVIKIWTDYEIYPYCIGSLYKSLIDLFTHIINKSLYQTFTDNPRVAFCIRAVLHSLQRMPCRADHHRERGFSSALQWDSLKSCFSKYSRIFPKKGIFDQRSVANAICGRVSWLEPSHRPPELREAIDAPRASNWLLQSTTCAKPQQGKWGENRSKLDKTATNTFLCQTDNPEIT